MFKKKFLIKRKNFLAFIPARSGSTRIPNKNIKLIDKKPLIYHTINSSLMSKYISDTVLFSDSSRILKLGKKFGANTKYKRPKYISQKKTLMSETIKYFIKKYNIKKYYNYLVLLQPTSPLRNTNDINKSCNMILKNKKADGLVSTHKVKEKKINGYPDKFMYEKNKFLKKIDKNKINQINKKLFLRNGPAIYIIKTNLISKNLYRKKLINYVMPISRSLDINTFNDLNKLKK
jgi:CMP-N,N'-diacetyllegionaminic acid synthase